jgi:prevent-host-death family protein
MLEKAQRGPITIQKQGRNAAVLMSYEEFERISGNAAQRFLEISARIGRNAKKRGLTDKEFDKIMAQYD